MFVLCDACKTENRSSAMFCRGCAGKLPAFSATGPSALAALKTRARVESMRPAFDGLGGFGPPTPGMLPLDNPRFWIGVISLVLALAVGFVSWYAYVTRRVPTRPIAAVPAAAAPAPSSMIDSASASTPAPAGTLPRLALPVPLGSSLSAGEAEVESGAATASLPEYVAPQLPEQPRPSRPAAAVRFAGADPRQGCSNLNFFAAARCEAAQCDKPEFSRHPRCDAVREDRRRDEARRNPTLGY